MNTSNRIKSGDQGILAIGQHFDLINSNDYDPALFCDKPAATAHEASYLESCAIVTGDDVADTLTLLGSLIAGYPQEMGDEEILMRQVGSAVRLLGDVLTLTNKARDRAGEAVRYHRLATQAAAS